MLELSAPIIIYRLNNLKKDNYMFQQQWLRVKQNIKPFIYLGILSGFITSFQKELENNTIINWFLEYSELQINYDQFAKNILFEHFAPTSLSFLICMLFLMSAIHRIIYGAVEFKPSEQRGTIYAIENFISLLAIALLGLMIGISIPAGLFEGAEMLIKFMIIAITPVLTLIVVTAITQLIHHEGIHKLPKYLDEHSKWKVRTRIEGIVVLLATLLFAAHQKYFFELQIFINSWALSFA